MRAIDREICTILRGIIEKKDRAIKNGDASSDDLLGLLVELRNASYFTLQVWRQHQSCSHGH